MSPNEATLEIEQLYRDYKPLLASIAYRMLGSMSEAEDAVQDVFVTVSKQGAIDMEHPKAYLVKMTTNRVLNMMKAAPRKRETYPGQWLPEPLITMNAEEEPLEQMLRRERLGYAILVLLQTCTPPERAVFVLRESLGYDYADIAAMLDKSEAACRKIYSRAAAKVGHRQREEHEAALDASIERFAQSFTEAVNTGQLGSFIHLLTDNAVLLTDGGGVVRSAINPIRGSDRIVAFFAGIASKGSLVGRFRHVWISGQRGLLLERENHPPFAFIFEPDADNRAIRAIYMVSNPQKLTRVTE
ncbi:RNA polymerase, sigma-24 subunit, ECF subfamily [Paenibacillus curdlanolyticus YK9]|uniref:RNA polymerase, sigma-24 subunit, ECF subfamily n=1 Tax=Paenibacillus curdlanolyticus YK9 TaxID=717606 RepID=E0I9T1_9BACL|nr:sigma-70 family RNA polymerase sigma factor [Paenibacillus curdlanolyticus]EFM11165.1 RNA polymerase, sigma-24 subunit, ECF subfamily [Paenibacillus curdlanolyticus YK9]